ncbi:MAG: hypothetical protein R2827_09145 [Bdellovibrionales bacterium]
MEALMQFNGVFHNCWLGILSAVVVALALGYLGLPFVVWYLAILAGAFLFGISMPVIIGLAVVLGIFVIPPIRTILVTNIVMKLMKGILPKISETERVALDAGVVWAEADLFSGKPNFKKLIKEDYAQLTAEEQAFIDGPVEELCSLIDDWESIEKEISRSGNEFY